MRRYIAILALLLVGCSEPEPQTIINEIVKDPTYTDALSIVGISRSDFGGQGGTAQIIVKSNVDYNITSDQQWLTVVEGSRATDLAHNKAVNPEFLMSVENVILLVNLSQSRTWLSLLACRVNLLYPTVLTIPFWCWKPPEI